MATVFKIPFLAWTYFFKCQVMRRYSPNLIKCILRLENTQKLRHFQSSNAERKHSVCQLMQNYQLPDNIWKPQTLGFNKAVQSSF